MEVTYKHPQGFERKVHTPAECVQLEAAGWKKVDDDEVAHDPAETTSESDAVTAIHVDEEFLTGDEPAEEGLDK